MTFDAQRAANKWASNYSNSAGEMEAGARAVTVAPNQKAAESQDKYLAGVQAAVASGRYRQGNLRVSLPDWQNAYITKGIQTAVSRAESAKEGVARYFNAAKGEYDRIQRQVAAMPNATLEQRLSRMMTNAREMSKLKGRYGKRSAA